MGSWQLASTETDEISRGKSRWEPLSSHGDDNEWFNKVAPRLFARKTQEGLGTSLTSHDRNQRYSGGRKGSTPRFSPFCLSTVGDLQRPTGSFHPFISATIKRQDPEWGVRDVRQPTGEITEGFHIVRGVAQLASLETNQQDRDRTCWRLSWQCLR